MFGKSKFYPVKTGYTALGVCYLEAIPNAQGDYEGVPSIASAYAGRMFAGRVSKWRWQNGNSISYLLTDTGAVTPEGKPIEPIVQLTQWWNSPKITPEKAWKFYINQLNAEERKNHPKPQRRGGGFFIMFPL